MKKIIFISILTLLTFAVNGQGLFNPVPDNLFSTDKAIKAGSAHGIIIPRLNVGVEGFSYGRNPETKQLEVTPFSAMIFGLAFLHYKSVNGLPFNDFGIMPAYLQLLDKAGSGVGLYGTYNTGQVGLFNIGGHYDFAINKFLIDAGLTFHF